MRCSAPFVQAALAAPDRRQTQLLQCLTHQIQRATDNHKIIARYPVQRCGQRITGKNFCRRICRLARRRQFVRVGGPFAGNRDR